MHLNTRPPSVRREPFLTRPFRLLAPRCRKTLDEGRGHTAFREHVRDRETALPRADDGGVRHATTRRRPAWPRPRRTAAPMRDHPDTARR